jgi:HSP20 family molecular chaperone IbpA
VAAPLGSERVFDRLTRDWPSLEVSETDKEIKVSAELPGLEDKDVKVELTNGVLAISGEKRTETEDKKTGSSANDITVVSNGASRSKLSTRIKYRRRSKMAS